MIEKTALQRATLDDKDILLDLMQRQFAEHRIESSSDELERAIKEMFIRDGLGFFVVAKKGNQVIGFAVISYAWTLEHGGKSAWLDELYVLPEHRNKGFGDLLVEKVIEEAKREGCYAIDLEVEEEHSRAEHLYVRKGFEKLARRRWVKKLD